ncbi:nuclear transport factor 2 family protein [Shimia sp. R10_1]|uniref:nuclear transport factor 2 family protein n=1 Tax=Shimia sp. R10_1 TaxID=2821095 RepID=UPI001ADBC89C|nr:nuclear transport factor 2 family protein [Shimia sp. R10_1]MBO9472632.1 nuclear transport factor 2 family protein [Shimia sp. R10_1]
MKIENDLKAKIAALEGRVWTALVKGDPAADAALLSADFLGVYPSGFGSKADHVGQLAEGPTIADFRLSEMTFRAVSADGGLLVYRADYLRVGSTDWEAMLISSLWQRATDGAWRNSFSQDTPLTDVPVP